VNPFFEIMKLLRRQFLNLAAGAAALPMKLSPSSAQTYPSRPVRMIVPFAPGGQVDAIARLIAQIMFKHFDKQFYIENTSGAGGNIGMGRAAQSMPDGHTILVVEGTSFVVNPTLYATVPYDPYRDFDCITIVASSTAVLTVNLSLPARTVRELIDLVKANPGKYSYSSPGVGTTGHLVGELFRMSLGLDLVHVPFPGAGPAVAATIAGHTPISFGSAASTIGQVKEGKLRALAVATRKRLQALPDVPTMAESGYPHIEANQWVGLLAPAGTPKDIVASIYREVVRGVALEEIRERLATLGFEPIASTPEDMAKQITIEAEIWGKVVRSAKIKAG
jgi:tripartite-type tricarboxylate transporter receptor subunit TctC